MKLRVIWCYLVGMGILIAATHHLPGKERDQFFGTAAIAFMVGLYCGVEAPRK